MSAEALPIFVRYDAGRLSLTGAISQDALITAEDMLNCLLEAASERSVDLIAIATGVYVIDRVNKRKLTRHNDCGIRNLRVIFEVSDYEFWKQDSIREKLTGILIFLTGDAWIVSFRPRSELHRGTTPQQRIGISVPLPARLGLFSGGLDSAAGLANRVLAREHTYMLLTVGHHTSIRSRSRMQIGTLRHSSGASSLHDASFTVNFEGGLAGDMKRQETSQRARGFLFCAAAAILADACDMEDVELFENGIGAINLPLTEGGLTDGLSTRGAHPGFLAKMGPFVSEVLGRPLRFTLPFLWHTKADMVRPLADHPKLAEWLQQSSSCIHTSIRESGKRHCGHCPACIERRQAFHMGGIADNPKDYQIDLLNGGRPKRYDYLMSYLENARQWKAGDPLVQSRLARHRLLSDATHLSLEALEGLLVRHAHESLSIYGDIELREAA